MSKFNYTSYAQEIIFGVDALALLGEATQRFGWKRLLLCSSRSLRRDGSIAALEAVLGERLVAVYEQVQPHVADFQVREVHALVEQHLADAVIGLGGGSVLGMAKAVSFAMEKKLRGEQHTSASPLEQPQIPIVAIPTTYAGSEMTPIYGITQHGDGVTRKVTVTDGKVTPKLVIYDPLLTLSLPPALTASTGINALAHCIEALYSITRNPFSTAVAIEGVRHIMSALPLCQRDGDNLKARTEMLEGACLAGKAMAHIKLALHHGLCHVLGGTANVPHGLANAIVLPHAMRFNLDVTADLLVPAAAAMGITVTGRSAELVIEEMIQTINELIGSMQLPQRLREVGVREEDLPALARLAFENRTVQSNPKPIALASQLEAVLRAAW